MTSLFQIIENRKLKPIWADKKFKLSDYEKEEQRPQRAWRTEPFEGSEMICRKQNNPRHHG
jgi:hypothetical protein